MASASTFNPQTEHLPSQQAHNQPNPPIFHTQENDQEFKEKINGIVNRMLIEGHDFVEMPGGINGKYIIYPDSGSKAYKLIFKPTQEEGSRRRGRNKAADLLPGVEVGSMYKREFAAYLLRNGSPSIPLCFATLMLRKSSQETKTYTGTLQKFLDHQISYKTLRPEDRGNVDLQTYQKILADDIQTFNADRHEDNFLVTVEPGNKKPLLDNKGHLIIHPIDQGCIGPNFELESGSEISIKPITGKLTEILWKDKRGVPLAIQQTSEGLKNEVIQRRWEDLEALIKNTFDSAQTAYPQSSLRSLKIANFLLKTGLEKGLTLFEIGIFIYDRSGIGLTRLYFIAKEVLETLSRSKEAPIQDADLDTPAFQDALEKKIAEAMDKLAATERPFVSNPDSMIGQEPEALAKQIDDVLKKLLSAEEGQQQSESESSGDTEMSQAESERKGMKRTREDTSAAEGKAQEKEDVQVKKAKPTLSININ